MGFSRKRQTTREHTGFSLVELLIIVAIILIIAAIAIPRLLRSRMASNESSIVGSLRTINTAIVTYATTYDGGYPPALQTLGPPLSVEQSESCQSARLIDSLLASGRKSGYTIEYSPGPTVAKHKPGCPPGVKTYALIARPSQYSSPTERSFFTDESGIIRATSENRAAGPNDPPIN